MAWYVWMKFVFLFPMIGGQMTMEWPAEIRTEVKFETEAECLVAVANFYKDFAEPALAQKAIAPDPKAWCSYE